MTSAAICFQWNCTFFLVFACLQLPLQLPSPLAAPCCCFCFLQGLLAVSTSLPSTVSKCLLQRLLLLSCTASKLLFSAAFSCLFLLRRAGCCLRVLQLGAFNCCLFHSNAVGGLLFCQVLLAASLFQLLCFLQVVVVAFRLLPSIAFNCFICIQILLAVSQLLPGTALAAVLHKWEGAPITP